MPPLQPPPRPRQVSQSKLQGAVTGADQPERAAVNHPGVDGVSQPAPPRRGSVAGMAALKPPPLPGDLAQTVQAPCQDAPTLPAKAEAGQATVRIEDAPAGRAGGSLPPASQDPRDAQLAAQQRELDRLRALQSLPPDRGAWAKLGYKIGAAAAGALALVLTALGTHVVSKLGAAKDENTELRVAKQKTKAKAVSRDKLWNNWGDRMVEVLECRHRAQMILNKRQFPETLRVEPGAWPVAKDACGELPERPRELPMPSVVDELPEP